MSFKVGDLVRYKVKGERVYKVTKTYPDAVNIKLDRSVYIESKDKLELWCPKPDEYCWFLKEGEPPQLAKFYRKEYDTYIGLIVLNNTVGSTTKPLIVYASGIEPFVGVPSCY